MAGLPTGTLTLLFTDIAGSTRLLTRLGDAYGDVLADHDRLLRSAIAGRDGIVVDTQGDAFFAVFGRARDAVVAAVDAQRGLAAHPWPADGRVIVRMGLLTGEPAVRHGRYVGLDLHRASRICSAAHGGQVLVSASTRALIEGGQVDGVRLLDLGEWYLKDIDRPERLAQLAIDGLPASFPPLRNLAPGPSPAREPAPPSPETALSFGVLGPVQVWVEGRSPQIGAAKQRQLLAVLILRANQVVSADTLIDALWGERPPETATKAMQVYISQLRKLIEPEREERTAAQVLVSQPPGYRLVASPWSIDLHRFEQLWAEARTVGEGGDFEKSAEILREALGLWRGAPLADFAYEDYFAAEIARLTEMRLGALEDLIAAQLELGRHSDVVARLESLVLENPVREGLRGQLMLALYRCGRQADALAVYQEGRRVLLDELGIDPGPALQRLHRRILQHDPRLEAGPGRAGRSAALPERRSVLLATAADDDLGAMIAVAGPLAHGEADRELILARLVPAGMDGDALAAASAVLGARCAELRAQGAHARTAAFTSGAPAADIVRLAQQQDVELLVMDGRAYLVGGEPRPSEQVLEQAPCDVALFVPAQPAEPDHGVLVPFGGSEHDWAALELAAWISRSTGAPLRLAGTAAGTDHGRDASRLLADASLLLQRTAGITSEPLLIEPGATGIIDAASHAGLLVMGLGSGWRETGPGEVRSATARRAATPALFVRRGVRPGGLAPRETMTRFTWSLTGTTGSSR